MALTIGVTPFSVPETMKNPTDIHHRKSTTCLQDTTTNRTDQVWLGEEEKKECECECEMTTMLTLNTEGPTETTQHSSLSHQIRSGNNYQNRTKAKHGQK